MPKWTFYVDKFYVKNVLMLKVCRFNPIPSKEWGKGGGGDGYIHLPLQIFAIKSEPQEIFLKTFWLLIFTDN